MGLRRLFVLLLLFTPCVWGQQYPFLAVPGSPKIVKNLFQDSRGRLWLGGLDAVYFDGSRFFSLRDYGFPASESFDINEDASGAIWIAAETGVYRFSEGRVEEVFKDGVAINVFEPTPDLVIATVGPLGKGVPNNVSLVRIQRTGTAWKAETVMRLDSLGLVTLSPSGMLLYPWPDKGWKEIRLADVVSWHPGEQVEVISHPVPRAPGNGVMKLMRDHAGCLWWGSTRGAAYDCGDGLHQAPAPGVIVSAYMHEGPDGRMVLSDSSLLAVGRPGSFQIATRANGLPGLVDAILAKDGTLWLGATTGLYRFASPFRIEYWTIREGLVDPPWSITRSGNKIYAGMEKRIAVLNQDRQRWETLTTFNTGGIVSGLVGEKDGSILASFIDAGVAQVAPDGKVVARTDANHPKCCSMRLTKTPNGDIWLGGSSIGRLTRVGNLLNFDNHPLQTQPSGNVLGVKYEEHTRKLWACYNGGMIVRDESGSWKEITTQDGLEINGCWSLAPLPNGDVWYVYYGLPGISRFRFDENGHMSARHYGEKELAPEAGGDTLDADQRGWLWRGAELGFYTADAASAEAGSWLQLTQSDGFPANGMNTGSVFNDDDGSLWWGADNDLAHYLPPSDLVNPKFAPEVFISAFSWNGGAPRVAEAVEGLPHGSKVVAHIGSLQFDRRNALKLRYRVLPEQSDWRETTNLDLPLENLKWGSHTLEVQARVFTGPWSNSVRRTISVLPPLWFSRPFVYAYALVCTVFFVFYFFLHRKRLLREQTTLPELASLRLSVLVPEIQEFVGTLLDSRFEVGEPIAQGGFAYVMEGIDRQQKRSCAIKIFRNEVGQSESVKRRFEQEVSALQQVRHPNVVSILAHGTTSLGVPYLVMEFVEGKSLREVLNGGALAPARTAKLLRQLAEALEAIHLKGICHRDVKPENVMIRNPETSREEVVLIDFSISIVKEANETLHGLSRAAGTFEYMAPEQAIGYAQPSSDIYSLAKVVIEMFTGQRLASLLPNASMDLPAQVRELLASLSVHLSESSINLISAALEFDPSRRPESAITFATSIVQDLEMEPLNV